MKKDNFMLWITKWIPNRIKYWCAIHVGASATTGEYGSTVVPDLTFMDAIKRFGDDKCL